MECISTIDIKNLSIVFELPIIQNGIFTEAVNINNKKLKFINTCAFDSMSEIIVDAYCNSQFFKNNVDDYLNEHNNDFLCMIQKYFINHSLIELYEMRAQILLPIVYPDGKQKNVYIVNCVMNVASLFDKVTKSFSNRLGYLSCTNNKCMKQTTLCYQSKIIDSLTEDDLNTFGDLMRAWFGETTSTCRKCKDENAILIQKVGCYTAFDVEQFYVSLYEKNLVNNYTKNVNNLPTVIFFSNKKYNLVGVIGFRSNHYIIGSLNVYIALIIYVQNCNI